MLLAVCGALGACDSSGGFQGLNERRGAESVRIAISLAGDTCGVVSAVATVTAWDMQTIGPSPLEVAGATIQGTITGVPAGSSRTVTVAAFDGRSLAVYEGSTQVNVVGGQTTPANIVLSRTAVSCAASTGNIDVTGTIAGVAFSFTDAILTSDGVVHFFDAQSDRLRRLDLASRQFLSELSGAASLDAISMAVAPDGAVAYLGYVGGRMDALDLHAGTSSFFAAAAETVSSMVVAGDHLFTIDGSGAWSTQSLYQRATRARVDAADWRDSSRSIVYSPVRQRVYSLDSGVSPTDVNMISIDHAAGKLGAEVDSPYHGSYSLPNPIRLLPDESGVVVGSGIIFDAADLTYRTSLGLSFQDIAFLADRIYLIDTIGDMTQLRVLSSGFDILSADYLTGQACRLFAHAGELVLVTKVTDGFDITFITP
jgi:hypothetical protein